ncbi:hypothetical protein CTA2_921 [Colletotrichum tanaceti]|nr:hypothetical protein CTA2_921 [Colletotrichum tanaceti]
MAPHGAGTFHSARPQKTTPRCRTCVWPREDALGDHAEMYQEESTAWGKNNPFLPFLPSAGPSIYSIFIIGCCTLPGGLQGACSAFAGGSALFSLPLTEYLFTCLFSRLGLDPDCPCRHVCTCVIVPLHTERATCCGGRNSLMARIAVGRVRDRANFRSLEDGYRDFVLGHALRHVL